MSAVEYRLYKIMEQQIELFWFFQHNNFAEHVQILNVVAFIWKLKG